MGIKIIGLLYFYAILDPSIISNTFTRHLVPSQTMAQESFYCADKPWKNSATDSRADQISPGTTVRGA